MEWLVPWHSVADDTGLVVGMERELQRELSAGHPLFGLPVRTLGRRQDSDDVLFAVEDGTGRVAVVHLTWTRSPPENPPFPSTTIYTNIEAWAVGGMLADHGQLHEPHPANSDSLPWHAWPLIPFVLLIGTLVIIPLALLALLSVPYFFVYPDRHKHLYDFEGTSRQRQLLAQWRACYAKLSLLQRVGRGFKLLGRRMKRRWTSR